MENYQILLCILFGACIAAVVYLIFKISQSVRNKKQLSVLLLVSLFLGLSACTADANPIGNIRIYLSDNTEGRDTAQLSNSYMSTEIAKCALLEGTYTLEYDHLDLGDNHRIAQYRIEGINIRKGADEVSSTKEISTADGKRIL